MLLLWKFCSFYSPAGSVLQQGFAGKEVQDNELLRRFPHHNLTAGRASYLLSPLPIKKVSYYKILKFMTFTE